MKARIALILLTAVLAAISFVQPVLADGIIIPTPPPCREKVCQPPKLLDQMAIRYHHVTVKIEDQLAVTHVDQVFFNPNDYPIEGQYVFPLPLDAVVSNFTLWQDGKAVQGKVLDAGQARQKYEDIVRQMRDPALLEYTGRGAVEANIYPIPPQGERRIELEYTQALTVENGLVRYEYPLNTEKFSNKPLENVKVSVDISSADPIRAVYSPSHNIALDRIGDGKVLASYKGENVKPDKDFTLYYSIGKTKAFHLFTAINPGDPEDKNGFFLLLLAPSPAEKADVVSKDILLVLDKSGSMDGDKFNQAQAAAKFILSHLNIEDRFYISTFNSGYDSYASELTPANESKEAIQWVNGMSAAGSTDINRALLEAAAVADNKRPTYLIFLTDGLPTEGVIDSQNILTNFEKNAPGNLKVFPFGVGYDVDTFLLDSLAQAHHGISTYVKPGESLEETLSAFYAKISTPVLTDLTLDFGNMDVYDMYPNPLPDLFEGTQVVVTGRYRTGGKADIKISGKLNGEKQEFNFPGQEFSTDTREITRNITELPRLWATRKVGFLLNNMRLKGVDKETINQIVKLSIRYGIVTPYTSYLITEESPLGVENQDDIARKTYENAYGQPNATPSGAQAVQKSADQGKMEQADSAQPVPEEMGQLIRAIGARTFVLKDHIWIDTTYDPAKMKVVPVAFMSDDYFALVESNREIAAAFALGDEVIFVSNGTVYQVVKDASLVKGRIIIPTKVPTEKADVKTTLPASNNPPGIYPTPAANKPTSAVNQVITAGMAIVGGLVLIAVGLIRVSKK